MNNLKNKVNETAGQMKNAVTETVDKIGHAATEALHKGDHALSDLAHKAKDLAVETTDRLKEVGGKIAGRPHSGAQAAAGKIKNANDKGKMPGDKTKNGAH
jgi:hypothetical protein